LNRGRHRSRRLVGNGSAGRPGKEGGVSKEIHALVVDDDAGVRAVLRDAAALHGLRVTEAATVNDVWAAFKVEVPDIVLLDVRMPDGDGLDVARRLRATSTVPIIMLTGLSDDADRILGLEIGADDYIVKPFNPREVIARIRAVLRRARAEVASGLPAAAAGHDCRLFNGWVVDLTARTLTAPGGVPVSLTNVEFLLLATFVQSPRRVLSRDQILDSTHLHGEAVFDRTIDVLVLRLRRKIEPNPSKPSLIRTERGAGYVFDADVETL
jgi:two-component system, OmpR family, response regulator